MNKVIAILVIFVFVSACSTQSNALVLTEDLFEAINTKNMDSAISQFSDDATIQFGDISRAAGSDQIADWLNRIIKINTSFQVNEISTSQNEISCDLTVTNNLFSFHGVDQARASCSVTVSDGKIQELSVEFEPEMLEKLFTSMPTDPGEFYEIWSINYNNISVSPDIPSDWWYLEFTQEGTARWGHTPESMGSEVTLENPGVWLEWSLDGGMLRLKNIGSDTEPYCSIDDLGLYLAKIMGEGDLKKLKLKVVEDSCLGRDLGFASYGTPWQIYSP